jgi:hypothetical protein
MSARVGHEPARGGSVATSGGKVEEGGRRRVVGLASPKGLDLT